MKNEKIEEIEYRFGAMSSEYKVVSDNKLVAYAAMAYYYGESAHMVAIYAPESSKKDSWLDPLGRISERLDEIFGGEGSFDSFVEVNSLVISKCLNEIEEIS